MVVVVVVVVVLEVAVAMVTTCTMLIANTLITPLLNNDYFTIVFFQHGKNSSHPLAYSHLDIAGSAHMAPKSFPSGVPVVALSGRYILGNGIDQAKNDN